MTVEAQSALSVAVSSVPGWNYGQMTQVSAGLRVQTCCSCENDVKGDCKLCCQQQPLLDISYVWLIWVVLPVLQLTRTSDNSAATATFTATTAALNGTVPPQVQDALCMVG